MGAERRGFRRRPAYDLKLSYSGNSVTVPPFSLDGRSYTGGTVAGLPDGTWYVGVDLFSGRAIALPRLGHRGWIPLAVFDVAGSVTNFRTIEPVTPRSRLPNTTAKILAGKTIKTVILGSSLVGSMSTGQWPSLIFGSQLQDYSACFPSLMQTSVSALGGAPNLYTLAQVGYGSRVIGGAGVNAGYPALLTYDDVTNGRSQLLDGADLVVMTTLANGGDGSVDNIDVIVRRLVERGIEVVLCTDNPQGAPFASYAALTSGGLYQNGGAVIAAAEKYGVEVVDTAAYVVAQYFALGNSVIYSDSIHMTANGNGLTAPNGSALSGHELYARAIRSVFPARLSFTDIPIDFVSGIANWIPYGAAAGISLFGSALRVTRTLADGSVYGGAYNNTPWNVKNGDRVRVRFSITMTVGSVQFGLQGDGVGWGSNVVAAYAPGTYDFVVTATRDITNFGLLFYVNSTADPVGTTTDISNLIINACDQTQLPTAPPVKFAPQALPPLAKVGDLTKPGDAFVTLPPDEYLTQIADANKGTLGAHPLGAGSFARVFNSAVSSSQDLLTVASGKRASMSAFGAVSYHAIVYSTTSDSAAGVDVYLNGVFKKSITVTQPGATREQLVTLLSMADINNASATPDMSTVEIRVTSNTVKVAALVAVTFDIEYLSADTIQRVGTWTGRVAGGPPDMPGYGTDTSGDYATVRAPDTCRKLWWLLSSKANSKVVDVWARDKKAAGVATVGTSGVKLVGGLPGGGPHRIKLTQTQSNTDQATNGYGLHVGGALVVRDR